MRYLFIPLFLIIFSLAAGVFGRNELLPAGKTESSVRLAGDFFDIEVYPRSFSLYIISREGTGAWASRSDNNYEVADLRKGSDFVSWTIPEREIKVTLEMKGDHLDVNIISSNTGSFKWPEISKGVEAYTLPWYQGKYIPARDSLWIEFWNFYGPFTGAQHLSMQFLGVNFEDFALVYIISNMFNNRLELGGEESLRLSFTHEFPATVEDRRYGFRIYKKSNDPVAIAKTYKEHVNESGRFVTLEQKAGASPGVRKLYGAPHIYLWGDEMIVRENIADWKGFADFFLAEASAPGHNVSKHILGLAAGTEYGDELAGLAGEPESIGRTNLYLQNLYCSALNAALSSDKFFDSSVFDTGRLGDEISDLAFRGAESLSYSDLFRLNKYLFFSHYGEFLAPLAEWGNGTSLFVLDKLQEMGVKRAWLGLASFRNAFMHPGFIDRANELGYLTGVYDSYHSIHEPGNESWRTATFKDTTLYYTAAIMNRNGEYERGYQGVGRKLNPLLSFGAVKDRLNSVLGEGVAFNSWFIDCDATGEVFDDYTEGRMTSQYDDMNARLERMAWIRDEKGLVIGSETGNDFAAGVIAYAHGMNTQVLPWQDRDWRVNRDSEYFVGTWYAPGGGVPLRFSRQVPVKELYRYIYFDSRFSLPLFQLVYNNSVITSHHWEFGSLKFSQEVDRTRLREILYNVPPLYNLDRRLITRHRELISEHVELFARTHQVAVTREMTAFEWLTGDRLVQRTQFGEDLEIIANFGDADHYHAIYGLIPPMSLIVADIDKGTAVLYTTQ